MTATPTPPRPGDLLELSVDGVAAGGATVGRSPDGRVVFVRHAVPGERVRAVVTEEARSFLRADAVEVLEASPDRVEPPCPWAGPGRCGGCDWQHVALGRQRELKAERVRDELRRQAGIDLDLVVEPVPGDREGLDYRLRVQWAVDEEGTPGLRRHRSHELVPVDVCRIAHPAVERLDGPLRGAAGAELATTDDGSARVLAVTTRDGKGRSGGADLPGVDAGLVVDGRPLAVPHGLRHTVRGRRFEVAAGGFWQVHRGAAEALAAAVLDGLEPRSGDRVADLYAGVGLFAALLGDAVGPSGSVVAVEGDARACADAARNTADQPHVRIRTAAVDGAAVRRLGEVDLVVVDPPRTGAGRDVTEALAALRPRRVAWVGCDPATAARDLRRLLDAGWALRSLRAFDLFPMTEHVEVVAVLERPALTG